MEIGSISTWLIAVVIIIVSYLWFTKAKKPVVVKKEVIGLDFI